MNAGKKTSERRPIAKTSRLHPFLILLLLLPAAAAAGQEEEARAVHTTPDLPSPEYFIAEPAPNDDGTHVGLRWPRAKDGAGEFDYVVYISRRSEGPWLECARTSSGAASVTDSGVAGFYPYRFSEGDEHHFIVEPAACMSIYWLEAERRYADWVKSGGGTLLECEQFLVKIRQTVREQKKFQRERARLAPRWEAALLKAKKRYVERFGLSGPADGLDVPGLLDELNEAKEKLDEDERSAIAALEEKLSVLSRANRYATYLSDSGARSRALKGEIAALRAQYLAKTAEFFSIVAAFRAESRLHLGTLLGLEPGTVRPEAVADGLKKLEQERDEAAGRAASAEATAADYENYDRLAYACQLGRHYVELAEKGISMAQIEADMLWQLGEALAGAAIERDEFGGETPAPDGDALLDALSEYRRAGLALEAAGEAPALEPWQEAADRVEEARQEWAGAKLAQLKRSLTTAGLRKPEAPYFRREKTRLAVLAEAADKRSKKIKQAHSRRTYYFRLGVAPTGEKPVEPLEHVASAAAEPALFDDAKLANAGFALFFTGAVLGMFLYVRRNPNVFLRRIAGLEAVEEAIGRATEMGKPALFVHGLKKIDQGASVLASLSILGRIGRRIADYDSDLLVANSDPIVYSISHEVVQEGYVEAGRSDAFKPDNIFMAASEQFPFVAAVASIMKARRPAANFFMGYFYAESLILAEVGASTGAIQIAATDSFTQLPFFITTCDYTLMGEELYAAGAYLAHNTRMLATIKAQDIGKMVLLAALPIGSALSSFPANWVQVIFTTFEKGF
ncbi:MAG: hypothetical protein QGH74_10420 [Candidatus Brocadiia bacterium]|nr:hypothetical protein [Candidatus Brocadiia bacterium]